jgi:hypothetical protein
MTAIPIEAQRWARTWATARPLARPMPRRGAWYPVVGETSGDRIVLEVSGRKVAIAKRFLEIRPARPKAYTVVVKGQNEANPAQGTQEDLGRTYAVCPQCGHRNGLFSQPPMLLCEGCRYHGEVAWWEAG